MSADSSKEYGRKRREFEKEVSAAKKASGVMRTFGRLPRADIEARLAEIPDDTRDLTARLCGDPLPGRSALDARK